MNTYIDEQALRPFHAKLRALPSHISGPAGVVVKARLHDAMHALYEARQADNFDNALQWLQYAHEQLDLALETAHD